MNKIAYKTLKVLDVLVIMVMLFGAPGSALAALAIGNSQHPVLADDAPPADPTAEPTVAPTEAPVTTDVPANTDVITDVASDAAPLGMPTLSTDKADYAPEETVQIAGSGFVPDVTYAIPVMRPDGSIVVGDGSFAHGYDIAVADADGYLYYSYQLDGILGTYDVRVYPTTWAFGEDGSGWLETPLASVTFTDAANPSGNLNQCANGGVGDPPIPCTTGGPGGAWQNGNLNGQQAHYLEGDSVPYRLRMADLSTTGTDTVIIEWDTTQNGLHALDYLTSFDRTETTADPCAGVSGCSLAGPKDTFAIPADPNVTDAGVTPIAGFFTMFNGDITSVSAYTLSGTYTGNSKTRITINFTASAANPVLAWGGHIATRLDWGFDKSAVTINGSPYHMRFIDLDGKGGNQDRSLSSDAVVFPAEIKIIKDAVPNDPQDFPFTTTGLVPPLASPGSFTLDDDSDPTLSNFEDITNILSFGTKTVTEGSVSNWPLYALSCTGTPADPLHPSLWTPNLVTQSVSIDLKEGDYVECTFTDKIQKVPPSVVTAIHDAAHSVVTSVPLGSTVHDSVSVTGSNGTATGNVTFDWFTNGSCSGTPAATSGSFALSGGSVDATTFTQGPLAAGSYSFMAHYGGSSAYFAGDSLCEPLTVDKAQLTVTTIVHNAAHVDKTNSNVPLGSIMHDTASVTGGVGGFALPAVSFKFYTNNTCTGGSAIALDGTLAPDTLASIDTAALGAGSYAFSATVAADANYLGDDSPCEPFTVDKAQLTVTTTLKNVVGETTIANGTALDLGTSVYDTSAFSGLVGSFSPNGTSTVTYSFFKNNSCTVPAFGTETVTVAANGTIPNSSATGALGTGNYAFRATYNGNANYNAATSGCEPFSVNKADTSTATEIHDASHNVVTTMLPGTTVHDKATVTSANTSFAIGGTVTFTWYTNASCSGTGTAAGTVNVVNGVAHPSTSFTPMAIGGYSFKAHFNGDGNFKTSDGPCEPLQVLPKSHFTDTMFCPLPTDGFRLLFTPDPQLGINIYKLNATNPGQYYYNVFYLGTPGATVTLNISVPYPFITQGAVPIQAHDGLTFTTINGQTCYMPSPSLPGYDVTTQAMSPVSASGNQIIGFEDYSPKTLGTSTTVTGTVPSTGLLYITIHLDYGFKGTTNWTKFDAPNPPDNDTVADDAKNITLAALGIAGGDVTILSPQTYTASFNAGGPTIDSDTFNSINLFKKDPGIGGLVLNTNGDPVKKAKVQIYLGTSLKATVYTDEDGWYLWSYKWTGKAATFIVNLPVYNLSQTVTLKANGFLVVSFTVPQ